MTMGLEGMMEGETRAIASGQLMDIGEWVAIERGWKDRWLDGVMDVWVDGRMDR